MAKKSVEGFDGLIRAFDGLEKAAQNRVLRRSMNRALTPLVAELRRNAPRGKVAHRTYKGRLVAPGFLSKNIKKSTRVKRDKNGVSGLVKLAGEAFYGKFIEHGWIPKFRNGKRGEKVPGKDWFFPVVDRMQGEIPDRIIKEVGDQSVKEWLKK